MMTSHNLHQSLNWRYMHQQHWRGDGKICLLFHPKSIVNHGLVLFQYGLTIVDYGLAIEILWACYCYNMGLHGLRDLGLGAIQKVCSPCWGEGV